MSGLPEIPDAPEPGDCKHFSYDIYHYQPELVVLEKWIKEVGYYVDEPSIERMRKFRTHPEASIMEHRTVAMSEELWEELQRKAQAFDKFAYAFSRLLHFTQGQQQALQEIWKRDKR